MGEKLCKQLCQQIKGQCYKVRNLYSSAGDNFLNYHVDFTASVHYDIYFTEMIFIYCLLFHFKECKTPSTLKQLLKLFPPIIIVIHIPISEMLKYENVSLRINKILYIAKFKLHQLTHVVRAAEASLILFHWFLSPIVIPIKYHCSLNPRQIWKTMQFHRGNETLNSSHSFIKKCSEKLKYKCYENTK